MKKMIAALFIIGFSLSLAGLANDTPSIASSINYRVQKLHARPSEDSGLVFEIPLEVVLLDISEDANWHKVKISFSFGPFQYTYVGWAKIPVGEALAAREKTPTEIADASAK